MLLFICETITLSIKHQSIEQNIIYKRVSLNTYGY